ncbi:MAG: hypothetical protein FWC47_14015 [Oscillospiraceae bacterium]|nr:hypothetical protein [Oscillospiraceae bacterium]
MDIRNNEFEFTLKRCEELDACVKVPCDPRGVISGRIFDCCNRPIKNATLKLLERTCRGELIPLTHTFTDECGFFLFGPLCPCTCYVIKIFVNGVNNRCIKIDKCQCDRDIDCLEACNRNTCRCEDVCEDEDDDDDDDDDDDECECNCRRRCRCGHRGRGRSSKDDRCGWRRESKCRRPRHNKCECDFDDDCFDF